MSLTVLSLLSLFLFRRRLVARGAAMQCGADVSLSAQIPPQPALMRQGSKKCRRSVKTSASSVT